MISIEWNEKGQRMLSPLQRDAYERGAEIRRLAGKLFTDADGNVWYREGEHQKLVGSGGRPTLADRQPAGETHVERDLDAPAAKAKAKPRKRAKRR